MMKLREVRMNDTRRTRRARWSPCKILAAVVLLPEINAPSMPSFSSIVLAAGASVIVLAVATRTSPLQALDDAVEQAAERLRQRAGVLRGGLGTTEVCGGCTTAFGAAAGGAGLSGWLPRIP
jgi:hypothetical protein